MSSTMNPSSSGTGADHGGWITITSSLPAAVVATAALTLLAIGHGVLFFRLQTWFFHLMLSSAILEAISFGCRAYTVQHQQDVLPFLVAYLLPILIPSFMAAACYMAFGRIVWYITPPGERRFERLWVPPRWITPLFVTSDVGAFLIQLLGVGAVGAAVAEKPQDQTKLSNGYRVLKFGLIIQLLCFAVFAIVGFRFFVVSRGWNVKPGSGPRRPWRQLLNAINVCATLITLRSVYRVLEFSTSAAREEWMFYVFEVLPLSGTFLTYIIIHPGHCLPQSFTRFRLNKRRLTPAEGSYLAPDEQEVTIGLEVPVGFVSVPLQPLRR